MEGTPRIKALSFGVGIFVAFTPTYGLHTLTVVLLSWLFRLRFSIVLLASWVNNPWTIFPIFFSSYMVGRYVFSFCPFLYTPYPLKSLFHQLAQLSWKDWFSQAPAILVHEGLPFVVGSLLLGTTTAFISYLFMLRFLEARDTKKGGYHGENNP
jgi:uncharacterized protein (DUF2062 family)